MSEKHLEKVNFEFIRYANCWEDADVLLEGLNPDQNSKIMSIASAGDNCFSLLSKSPKKVIAVDVSEVQLFLVELKKIAIQRLDYSDFLEFIGVRKSKRRRSIFALLKSHLRKNCRQYWEKQVEQIELGLIHQGKFEKYFQLFKNDVLPTVHDRTVVNQLFAKKNNAAQLQFHDEVWHTAAWEKMYRQFFGVEMMGSQGRDPEFLKHVKGSVPDLILAREVEHLRKENCQRNYFLYYILYNEFNEAFLPHYLRKENFNTIKANIDHLELHHGLLDSAIDKHPDCTHFNLSDIFEYMDDDLFRSVSQDLITRSAKGAIIAYWNLMIPRYISTEFSDQVTYLKDRSVTLKAIDLGYFYANLIFDQKK
ncbi:MAG: DUF3419 family protein [Crocinitomix sp.]|nr:DUF3419 family protein [Crocinitomix sp.]